MLEPWSALVQTAKPLLHQPMIRPLPTSLYHEAPTFLPRSSDPNARNGPLAGVLISKWRNYSMLRNAEAIASPTSPHVL